MYFTFKTHLKLLRLLDSCDFAKKTAGELSKHLKNQDLPKRRMAQPPQLGGRGASLKRISDRCAGARHFVVHQTVEQRSEFESR